MIATFADAWGWSKSQVLDELYPEEVPILLKRITKRERNRQLERICEWEVLLDITIAPHTKNGRGAIDLDRRLKQMRREIQRGSEQEKVVDLDFHRQLADLRQRRKRKLV